jgi:hypothetical protein
MHGVRVTEHQFAHDTHRTVVLQPVSGRSLPNGPFAIDVTWSLAGTTAAPRRSTVRDQEDHDHGALT